MRQKPLILNIEEIVHDQTSEYKQMLNESSASIRQDLNNSTAAVCDTIESGFEIVSEHLREISYDIADIRYEINAMSSILHWGFTQTIEQHRISNLLLGNISLLLRIPDFQKERHDYIEKGLKFLKNSFFDPEMFDDALKYLLKAEELEPEDYFTLYRIGLIYLNSPNCDISKAEIYFKKSAKYAIVETNEGATISNNILMLDVNSKFEDQLKESDKIKIEAAESYVLAARCCFLQNKFEEAAELAHKAFLVVPNMVEAGFLEAQALSANNEISKAVEVLRTVIQTDRFYSFKTARNLDLGSKKEIKDLLEEFKQEAFNKASDLLNICKINMVQGSLVENEIRKIEMLINKKSYLHSKKAIDLLSIHNDRIFSESELIDSQMLLSKLNKIIDLEYFRWDDDTLLIKDNYLKQIEDEFNELSNYSKLDFNLNFYEKKFKYKPTDTGYKVLSSIDISPKKLTSSLVDFVKKEKEYEVMLPKQINYLKTKIGTFSSEFLQYQKNQELEWQEKSKKYASAQAQERIINTIITTIIIIGSIMLGRFLFLGHTFLSVLIFIPAIIVAIYRPILDEYGDSYKDKTEMAILGFCLGIFLYWIL